jgi:uncharacterized membrane protein
MTGSLLWLAVACAAFVGSHLLLAGTGLRGALIARLGQGGYLGLFVVISGATLAWAIWAYGEAPHVELWASGHVLKGLVWLVMAPAVLLVVGGNSTPNPSAVRQEGVLAKGEGPRGIFTITRHPLIMGIALWAVAHLLANGDGASVLLFGSLLLLALVGLKSQEARKRATIGEPWRRFEARTSFLPFVGPVTGRARLDLAGIGWIRLAASVVLYALLVVLHPWAIGVSPMPA